MRNFSILVAFVIVLTLPVAAQVMVDAAHTVTINAQPLVAISVGADVDILLTQPGNGNGNMSGVGTSTYSLTSNVANNKISGYISDPAGVFPGGVSLRVRLARPSAGGASVGLRLLSAGAGNATDLVINIPAIQESGLLMSYTARAPASTPPSYSEAREVTYTITGN